MPTFLRAKSGALVLLATALSLGASVSSQVHANGRFPATVSIAPTPNADGGVAPTSSDSLSLYVGATFGLLYKQANSSAYRWICEGAVGYGGFFDPEITQSANGVLFATTFEGLARSEDQGCSWGYSHGSIFGHWVDGVSVHPLDPNIVLASTSSGGRLNGIMRSTDGGRSFTMVQSTESPREFFKSVRFAPGDPQRVYATSYTDSPITNTFWTSNDGGLSFTRVPFGLGGGPEFKIVAIAKNNSDIVIAKTEGTSTSGPAPYLLLRSDDGGTSFYAIYVSVNQLLSTVLSDDGLAVWVAIRSLGLFHSTDGGKSFNPVPGVNAACVSPSPVGLLVCANNYIDQFGIGVTTDNGATFSPVFRFSQLAGVVSCPPNATASWLPDAGETDARVDPLTLSRNTTEICSPLWPMTALQLGIGTEDAAVSPDSSFMLIDARARDGAVVTKPPGDGGCGCEAGGRSLSVGIVLFFTLISAPIVLMWRDRTKRRKS